MVLICRLSFIIDGCPQYVQSFVKIGSFEKSLSECVKFP